MLTDPALAVAQPATPPTLGVDTDWRTPAEIAQDGQLAVAHRLEDEFGQHPGWATVRLEPDPSTITLRWAGELPAELRELVSRPVDGITVRIQPVAYGEQELLAEIERLLARAEVDGWVPLEIGPARDRSHIELVVPTTVGIQPATALAARIPTTVTVAEPVEDPYLDRWSDSEPFWAGAVIENIDDTYRRLCTAGFPATRDGEGMILTARHCGPNDRFDTPYGIRVGTAGSGSSKVDAMMIKGRHYGHKSYVGETRGSLANRPIGGADNPVEGELLCASGGLTGQRCNARVQDTNRYLLGVGPGFIVGRTDRTALAGEGDSGGPVYYRRSDGRLGVRGMIDMSAPTAGAQVPCHGTGDRHCFWKIFAVNQGAIVKALDLDGWSTGW